MTYLCWGFGPCAITPHEPCQAGNRAALSDTGNVPWVHLGWAESAKDVYSSIFDLLVCDLALYRTQRVTLHPVFGNVWRCIQSSATCDVASNLRYQRSAYIDSRSFRLRPMGLSAVTVLISRCIFCAFIGARCIRPSSIGTPVCFLLIFKYIGKKTPSVFLL